MLAAIFILLRIEGSIEQRFLNNSERISEFVFGTYDVCLDFSSCRAFAGVKPFLFIKTAVFATFETGYITNFDFEVWG